ncbi:NADPH-dependent oxidoreductase [Thermococcus sp. GR7]|uniref:NADPH-dependent FMN reductase n=1 Tax=unclassified Thermococcus TaxID=2627626 RepID=UPI0014300D07|nr:MULTISPECIES: NAD(P)H-dependent oxidoreductase [unclassified Thermococcus]NJE47686.1 NADPH-dependent oxidoreductase [Thermococcus sp. GR7]NJE79133.1 NADPH-dependent oxidoreductase [Thermococcus sp. GR4]NJF22550.1 NADPH-dependent oxidoreductase [Thermococcus sp. GR5]
MKVKIVLGTAREGRKSEKVARYLVKKAQEFGWDAELIDVRDYLLAYTHRWRITPKMKKYREKILEADALIIVAPEYNGSYPGELKILLDTIYDEYEALPVGICTVSSVTGGVRLLMELRTASLNYRMLPVAQVRFYNVDDIFEGEELKGEKYEERVGRLFGTLEKYAKALKPIRDEVREKPREKERGTMGS